MVLLYATAGQFIAKQPNCPTTKQIGLPKPEQPSGCSIPNPKPMNHTKTMIRSKRIFWKQPGLQTRSNVMRSGLVAVTLGLIALLCPAPVIAHDLADELADAATLLVNALDEQQQQALSFNFDDDLRKDWQFVPMDRKGLSLKQLKPQQRLLAMSLIQTALSHRGFSQTMEIMALEQVLHEMENQNPVRDPEKYHLFLFGKPSPDQTWGWRVEGHHLSISLTIVDGETVVAAPVFFGTNPAEVRTGPLKGLRVLGAEEDLGRKLVKNLSVEQKEFAIVADNAPRDIINGPGRQATQLQPPGISADAMNENQQAMLRAIVEQFASKLRPELAKQDLEKIESGGWEKLSFAWAGKIQLGQPHYFRVQGPTFILEYDNTQNGANHAHSVWRDFKNDFGEDLLQLHYQKQHSDENR